MGKDILESEENDVQKCEKELEELSKKWFKTSKTSDHIEFLAWFIQKKKILIEETKNKITK